MVVKNNAISSSRKQFDEDYDKLNESKASSRSTQNAQATIPTLPQAILNAFTNSTPSSQQVLPAVLLEPNFPKTKAASPQPTVTRPVPPQPDSPAVEMTEQGEPTSAPSMLPHHVQTSVPCGDLTQEQPPISLIPENLSATHSTVQPTLVHEQDIADMAVAAEIRLSPELDAIAGKLTINEQRLLMTTFKIVESMGESLTQKAGSLLVEQLQAQIGHHDQLHNTNMHASKTLHEQLTNVANTLKVQGVQIALIREQMARLEQEESETKDRHSAINQALLDLTESIRDHIQNSGKDTLGEQQSVTKVPQFCISVQIQKSRNEKTPIWESEEAIRKLANRNAQQIKTVVKFAEQAFGEDVKESLEEHLHDAALQLLKVKISDDVGVHAVHSNEAWLEWLKSDVDEGRHHRYDVVLVFVLSNRQVEEGASASKKRKVAVLDDGALFLIDELMARQGV